MEAFFSSSSSKSSLSKAKASKASSKCVPWVEKYRPRSVLDVAHQDEVVAVLNKCLAKGGSDLPNLLFYGPPGTGKTSTILAAARDLFGNQLYKSRVLELNASDDRGISVVRDQIKVFARQTASATSWTGSRDETTPSASGSCGSSRNCPSFKIVVLDEADSMTRDAQSALRRIMEKEGASTRFCLVCNYVSRIIEPITSRCAKFRFKPLPQGIMKERLLFVANSEDLKVDEMALEALMQSSEGDLRKAMTTLQSASTMVDAENGLKRADVEAIAGIVPHGYIERLIKSCATNNFDKVQLYVEEMKAEGFSVMALLSQLNDYVVLDSDIEFNDDQKTDICERLALCESRLIDGASESLQLLDVALGVMETLNDHKNR